MAEQGILGRVLSMCEDVCGGGEPLSPWAGEGGYGRAPGFEREDQVRLGVGWLGLGEVAVVQRSYRCLSMVHRLLAFMFLTVHSPF